MAWPRNTWVTGEAIAAADLNEHANGFRVWGDNVNGGGYALSNFTVTLEAWLALSLQNSWVSFGTDAFGDWGTPSYRKDPAGRVYLRGRIKNGTVTSGTITFTLPTGYRPPVVLSLIISAPFAAPNQPQLVVKPNGECSIYNVTANTYLDLNVEFFT